MPDNVMEKDGITNATYQPPQDSKLSKHASAGESSGPKSVTAVVEKYLDSGNEYCAKEAIATLQITSISAEDARAIWSSILLQAAAERPLLDALASALIAHQNDFRKYLALEFTENATGWFSRCWVLGENSFRAFAALPYDNSPWPTQEQQVSAQRDLFRLSVAEIIGAGVEHAEWAMRVVARALSTAAQNVASIIDEDVFDVVLSSLDIRLSVTFRGQATIAASKMLETTGDQGSQMFAEFMHSRVAKQTNDDLIVAFSAAATTFPMIPETAAKLFMTDGFVQQLVPNLERNSEAASAGKRKSRTLEDAALELLSAACVEKSCREAIQRYCLQWLRNLADERDGLHQALCTLILAKIQASSADEVTEKLSGLAVSGGAQSTQAIEGLVYTSLTPSAKETICKDDKLMAALVRSLKEHPSTAFGCLSVFCNLTTYRAVQTEEQKKMAQLKAYANQSKPEAPDPLDNNTFVTNRCKTLLDHDAVSAMVVSCQQSVSLTIVALVTRVLLSLSREQKHRTKMAQQGAVKLLLQIRERISKTDKSTPDAATIERNASHALARMLISVNPSHVFTSAVPAASGVAALVPLLSDDHSSEQRDLLPAFEALLALTNLASMEDESVHAYLMRVAWDKIEDLLFSSNMLVQRASIELVCNLMSSTACVAKFADGSPDARRRVAILLALTDVEDLAARRAAGGALAMLTEWDAAVTAVLDAKDSRGAGAVLKMCQDDSEEVQHRGFVCLLNLVTAPGQVGKRGIESVVQLEGIQTLKDVLTLTRNEQIMALGVQVLQKLVV